ncbi:MAG TPA: hypothetical protein VD788_04425, partial [Candidatus Polarisedimenticolaceae bacterium]|nr:hypothetical protein [Candidatus Polarisedimenticolaceae bacterium]
FVDSLGAIAAASSAEVLVLLTPFRQDPGQPAYTPPEFYRQFRETVDRASDRHGLLLLDASSLLDRSHFGPYADGPEAGRIDVLHFDAAGHRAIAAAIEGTLALPRRPAGNRTEALLHRPARPTAGSL